LKRSGFKQRAYTPRETTQTTYTPRPRPVAVAVAEIAPRAPVLKDNPLQHQGYMAAVRELPCARCGIWRPRLIEFAHADILGRGGKGKGLKSDCRLGWPGCGPHDGLPGCHYIVGTSGQLSKAERHQFEADAGRRTRIAILSSGKWPKGLPLWPDDASNESTL
jgi:hypothetical protein